MRRLIAVSLLFVTTALGPAAAADCPGNPDALGVSRVLVVDPTEHPLLGELGYHESLPLKDHEVVLTFDDGPLPPHTSHILDVLKHECIKATFFMVGRMARAYPSMVKRVAAEGHTIANHSESHPFTFHKMSVEHAAQEIQGGFNSIRTALGNPDGVAPFFRFPGLLHQPAVERYLKDQGVQAWSVDVVADDWTHINSHEIVRRAMNRLEARGKGILLLHDIQPATALGLADLLAQLKAHGFKIVQVVPATPERPKTVTTPDEWIIHHRHEPPSIWPEPAVASLPPSAPVLATPSLQSFGVTDTPGALVPVALGPHGEFERGQEAGIPLPPVAVWPHSVEIAAVVDDEVLPVAAPETFHYSKVWRPNRPSHAAHRAVSRKVVHRRAMHQTVPEPAFTNAIPGWPAEAPAAHRAAPNKAKRTHTARVREMGHDIDLPHTSAPRNIVPRTATETSKSSGGLFGIFR
jgi:peptidoglycan/xylan/chitin deacetylase (PgdA/CDA1 family)